MYVCVYTHTYMKINITCMCVCVYAHTLYIYIYKISGPLGFYFLLYFVLVLSFYSELFILESFLICSQVAKSPKNSHVPSAHFPLFSLSYIAIIHLSQLRSQCQCILIN